MQIMNIIHTYLVLKEYFLRPNFTFHCYRLFYGADENTDICVTQPQHKAQAQHRDTTL